MVRGYVQMNYTTIVYVALIVNVFVAGLFPEQVGLSDPLGIDNIREQKFDNFDSKTQQYFITQGIYNEDGTPSDNFETFKDLQSVGEDEAGVTVTDLGFSFIDYLKIAWNAFKSTGLFLIAFIVIIFQLPLPIAQFMAPIFSILGIFALVKFIIGR